MQLIRRALGRESTPIHVAPIPRVRLTSPGTLEDQEKRLANLEDKVRVQTGRLTDHIESGSHGAN